MGAFVSLLDTVILVRGYEQDTTMSTVLHNKQKWFWR